MGADRKKFSRIFFLQEKAPFFKTLAVLKRHIFSRDARHFFLGNFGVEFEYSSESAGYKVPPSNQRKRERKRLIALGISDLRKKSYSKREKTNTKTHFGT